MPILRSLRRPLTLLLLLAPLFWASPSGAQTKQLRAWLDDLAFLASEAVGPEERRAGTEAIVSAVRRWIDLYPGGGVAAPEVPARPWNDEVTRGVITRLGETVQKLLERSPGRPFELGTLEISVTAETSPLSPVVSTLDHEEIRRLYAVDLAEAVPHLPGIGIDHNSSSGRAGLMIRGFDTRQVGLYLDGIPLYVPYDGFVDVSRFLSSDLAAIEVAKGYSSPLLGPNGLGGSVNLVTRRPEKKLDVDAALGTGSGDRLESWLHLGTAWRRFFLQGGVDRVQTDSFPLSGGYEPTPMQPDHERINSDRADTRFNGRLGWTPRDGDQYVLSYVRQESDYGVPPYSGTDTRNNKPKFWRWPDWKREMAYFTSRTALGDAGDLKLRLFYDRYRNAMTGFTDATYAALSSVAPLEDHSLGTSAEFSTRRLSRNALGVSFFLKDDIHEESAVSYSGESPFGQPWRRQHDRMMSIGVQDVVTLSSRLKGTVGFSADYLDAVDAEDLLTTVTGSGRTAVTTYAIAPFDCPGSDCLARTWGLNPLASLSYAVSESGSLFFSFARKSHFPTLKDRYSYRYGRAIPNPSLRPEHARNWNLGYAHALGRSTMLQADLFRSDVGDAIQNALVPEEFEGQCPSLAGGMCQQAVNVGTETHQGVELTLRSAPVPRLAVNANYGYLNWTLSGPSNMLGVHPVRAPRHKVVGTADYGLARDIHLMAAARYESGTVTTNDSGAIVPASRFATVDVGVIVPLGGGARLAGGVKNLLDRNYYYQEGFPEPGRNWHLSLRWLR